MDLPKGRSGPFCPPWTTGARASEKEKGGARGISEELEYRHLPPGWGGNKKAVVDGTVESFHVKRRAGGRWHREIMGAPNLVGPRRLWQMLAACHCILHEPQGGHIGKSHRRTVPGTQ